MSPHHLKRPLRTAASLLLVAGLAACDGSSTGVEDGASLSLGFRSTTSGASTSSSFMAADAPGLSASVQATGDNGTLTLESVFLVVDEFKAEVGEGDCDEQAAEESCARFEAEPFFLDVPLDVEGDGESETEIVTTVPVPVGTYSNFKFEVKGPDADLLSEIRDPEGRAIEDWPAGASVLVEGDFEGEPFRAFFSGEVRVELPIDPPLEVEDEEADEGVTVVLNPRDWFTNDDGTVDDLTQLDFDPETGEPVTKLEVKFLDGFEKIEVNE